MYSRSMPTSPILRATIWSSGRVRDATGARTSAGEPWSRRCARGRMEKGGARVTSRASRGSSSPVKSQRNSLHRVAGVSSMAGAADAAAAAATGGLAQRGHDHWRDAGFGGAHLPRARSIYPRTTHSCLRAEGARCARTAWRSLAAQSVAAPRVPPTPPHRSSARRSPRPSQRRVPRARGSGHASSRLCSQDVQARAAMPVLRTCKLAAVLSGHAHARGHASRGHARRSRALVPRRPWSLSDLNLVFATSN